MVAEKLAVKRLAFVVQRVLDLGAEARSFMHEKTGFGCRKSVVYVPCFIDKTGFGGRNRAIYVLFS
jgi:hypothetical protein